MSKLNTMTCLVSAGYPVWYAYGVSRGIISVHDGLRTDLVHVSSGKAVTGYVIVYYYHDEKEVGGEENKEEENVMPILDTEKLKDNAYLNKWLNDSIHVNEKEVFEKLKNMEDGEKKNEVQSGYEDVFQKNKRNSFALVLVQDLFYVGHIFMNNYYMNNTFIDSCINNDKDLKRSYDKQQELFESYKKNNENNKRLLKELKQKNKLFKYNMLFSHPQMFTVIGIQKSIKLTYNNFVQHMFKGLGLFAYNNGIKYVGIEQPLKIMQEKVKTMHENNTLKYEDFSIKIGEYLQFPIYKQENLNNLEGLELLNNTKIVDEDLSIKDSDYYEVFVDLVESRNLYNSKDIFIDIIELQTKT